MAEKQPIKWISFIDKITGRLCMDQFLQGSQEDFFVQYSETGPLSGPCHISNQDYIPPSVHKFATVQEMTDYVSEVYGYKKSNIESNLRARFPEAMKRESLLVLQSLHDTLVSWADLIQYSQSSPKHMPLDCACLQTMDLLVNPLDEEGE